MSPILRPDTTAVLRAAEALTTQVRRIADAMETPVVTYEDRAVDDATTPVTTCSAQCHRFDPVRECIRAAHHTGKDHVDEAGFHWSDTVAVYPLADSTVRIAHWHPVSEQAAEERQELAGMVEAFIDAQMRMAPAVDEDAQCLAHSKGACDGTTRDCVFSAPGTKLRRSLRVLLNRLNNGIPLGADEAQLLTRHVTTLITEANTARSVAAGNKRHVQLLVPELEQAQAAIERARKLASRWAVLRAYGSAATELRAALDGTEQPTTEEQR